MKIPYKYKGVVGLLLLTVVVPIIIYNYALSDTVDMWLECGVVAESIEQLETANTLRSDVVTAPATTDIIRSGALLATLASTTKNNDVAISNYAPSVTLEQQKVLVATAQITLTGGYIPLVKTIQHIETKLPQCKIVSADFRSRRTQHNKPLQLQLTLIVQQIILKK